MIRNGVQLAFQQPRQWGRNESGNYESWIYEGNPGSVIALARYFSTINGLIYQVEEGFGKWRITIQFPWNQTGFVAANTDIITKWELFASHEQKYLLEAIDNAGIISQISEPQKEAIKSLILNPPVPPDTTQIATFEGLPDANDNEDPTDGTNAYNVYSLMKSGMTNYLMEAPFLRRTITTNIQYAGYVLANVRKLLTTSTLFHLEQVPISLINNLAAYLGSDVSSDSRLAYGWYKSFPTVQQVALLKWQIVQEWQYGWWSTLYGTPL